MFGIDKDGIKKCFVDFNAKILSLPPSSDPVVGAIVKFIQDLSNQFK